MTNLIRHRCSGTYFARFRVEGRLVRQSLETLLQSQCGDRGSSIAFGYGRVIEEAIFAGVPVNVTLLFSREQYVAATEAYLRGIERRLAAGLNPQVGSVASMFIIRWDAAVAGSLAIRLKDEGAKSFVKSWNELLAVIASKSAALKRPTSNL